MNREFLKGLGLEDAAIDKVMAEHGKVVNTTKDDLKAATDANTDLTKQIKDRDKQLADLEKAAKGNEVLTAEIEKLTEANKNAAIEYQAKLDKQAFDFALEKALVDSKAKNPKAVKALLDVDKLKLDGSKLLGLDDQIKSLKESDPYQFDEEEEEEPGKLGGRRPNQKKTPPGNNGKNPFSKEHFNLTEQGRLFKEDPELYKQLKAQA